MKIKTGEVIVKNEPEIHKEENILKISYKDKAEDYDIKLEDYGKVYKTAYFASVEAVKMLKESIPQKIDRSDAEKYSFGRLYPISMEKILTNQNWKNRQSIFFKHGHFKSGRLLLPTIVNIMDYCIESYGMNTKVCFNDLFFDISLTTVFAVLFGEEVKLGKDTVYIDIDKNLGKIGKCKILNSKGKAKNQDFYDAFQYVSQCAHTNFTKAFERGVSDFEAILQEEPFKTDKINIDELHRVLYKYIKDSGKLDEMLNSESNPTQDITHEQLINDILNMIDAGSGTLYLAVISTLLRLKFHSEIRDKLLEELERCGLKEQMKKSKWYSNPELPGMLQQCEYLHYIVKETLRIDPPSAYSTSYVAVED